MKNDEIMLLVGEINEGRGVLEKMMQLYASYEPVFSDESKRELRDAVMLSEILCNSYTCLETLFFRISKLFENHLDAHQWHKDLLHKMCIEVPGIRKAVLSSESYALLDELRRFRHFKRHYYDFDYNWRKLEYLRGVYERLSPIILNELGDYVAFLSKLADSM